MKAINSNVHGVIDYLFGLLLLAAPNLFGFADGGTAELFSRIMGIVVLGQAVLTRYELGLLKVIPFSVHLTMDYIFGALLILSPWLFGFAEAETARTAMVVLGVIGLLVTMMTRKVVGRDVVRPAH